MALLTRHWWRSLYTNEIFLLFPFLSWPVVRVSFAQRVCDLFRTVPLLLYVFFVWSSGWRINAVAAAAVGGWTVCANAAMWVLDAEHGPYAFSPSAELLYALTLVSPLSFLSGSPAFLTGLRGSELRYVAIGLNVVAAAYIAGSILFVYPFSNAWACYPHPQTLKSLRFGYCPQYLQNFADRNACDFFNPADGEPSPLCDPYLWRSHVRSFHHVAPTTVHVAVRLLATSGALYLGQIPGAIYDMRSRICRKEA